MSVCRSAYLLTCNPNSPRCIFSKNVLESIGFNVILFMAIPDANPLISHKKSMLEILKIASETDENWTYIFEDDINVLGNVALNEIINYEMISDDFFYLGMCKYGHVPMVQTNYAIEGHPVYKVSGCVRGAHAIAMSKHGAKNFLKFAENFTIQYLDMLYELYTLLKPANVVRADLQSNVHGHLGAIFQDREKFPSIIDAELSAKK